MRYFLAVALCVVLLAGCGGGVDSTGLASASSSDGSASVSVLGAPSSSTLEFPPISPTPGISPDGTKYLKVISMVGGWIGVYAVGTDVEIIRFPTLSDDNENDIKAWCWAGNGRHIAVMYHGGMRPGASIYDTVDGAFLGTVGPDGGPDNWYHKMVFSANSKWLLVGTFDATVPNEVFPTGL